MSIQRLFLGNDQPPLQRAVDYLVGRYGTAVDCDMRSATVVVPGARAGRRFLELLVQHTDANQLSLLPPLIETVGSLPEQLYRPKRPFASELVQRLAWVRALQQVPAAVLAVAIPRPPADSGVAGWMGLADLLRRQHTELAADGLHFGEVASRGSDVPEFTEQSRWNALRQVQEAYLRELDSLELWDLQTARLFAVAYRECQTERDIILVGAVDLNQSVRQMLDQVADQVTALVFAPASEADRFDSHGCLCPAAWQDAALSIDSERILVADGPSEVAEHVVRLVKLAAPGRRADEIVVGVPDESLIPDLERGLEAAGITGRWGPGRPLNLSPPARFVTAVADFLEHRRFADYAALVRHPDLAAWLDRHGASPDHLEFLDKYQAEHLPLGIRSEWLGEKSRQQVLADLEQRVLALLGPLAPTQARGEQSRSLSSWLPGIWRLLTEVYSSQPCRAADPGDVWVHAAAAAFATALRDFAQVPAAILPTVTASQALRWLLDAIRNETAPADWSPEAVELLGWLELPLEDAPVLIVTGLQEGTVPASLNSDLFLPNALREKLGVLDNARRYARDAYAIQLLTASRSTVDWVIARRNHDGDPLVPSRLLFACDPRTAAERARQCFQRPPAKPAPPATRATQPESRLVVPRPEPLAEPIQRISVTAFRDYLACPYRFYLRHVRRLATVADDRDELDGGGFGNLAHEVLREFGRSQARESTSEAVIREELDRLLNDLAARQFGSDPLPAVMVQVEQLRWRLNAFAGRQAAWAAEGWKIRHVEYLPAGRRGTPFAIGDRSIFLTGRVDRIDEGPGGKLAVLDYKTADEGKSPEKTHRSRGEWIDLQLPLYRHLVKSLLPPGHSAAATPVWLGYVLLPKDPEGTAFSQAVWEDAELAEADELAREVVRRIWRQEFWPPAETPPAFSDDLSAICQDGCG